MASSGFDPWNDTNVDIETARRQADADYEREQRMIDEAKQEQRKADAVLIEGCHAEVLAVLRLGEKACWMPTEIAQRVVGLLTAKLRDRATGAGRGPQS